jgi:hypothetical protein
MKWPGLLIMMGPLASLAAAGPSAELGAIRNVGPEGKGNEAAAAALKKLTASPTGDLPELVRALDGSGPLAANWLRAAVDVVVERALGAGQPLPLAALEDILASTRHSGAARRLAWDLVWRADAKRAESLTMRFLDDPESSLRRPAVQRLIDEGKAAATAKKNVEAVAVFEKVLGSARDEDQVREIAGQLKDLGRKPDLPRHFGFVMDWQLIGPFDNTGRKGFDQAYPPERELNLSAQYEGKGGQPVKWVPFSSKDEFGKIDFNQPLGMLKEVAGYAVADFVSGEERAAELRLGGKNSWKVWLNGEILFGRDEYHRGAMLDQYRLPCRLRKGSNTILVKCCQNEQLETWTVEWEFQLRVCDANGTAILPAGK